MTRRPKLSLEPDRQIRREPPKRFSAADHAEPIAEENISRSGPKDPASKVDQSVQASEPESSATAKNTGAATSRSKSQPHASPKDIHETLSAHQPAGQAPADRGKLVKILLAAGIAALAIMLLKRRFF